MVKKGSSASYQKVQDSKRRSRAWVDTARAAGAPLPPPPPPPPPPLPPRPPRPPPPPRDLRTSSHPIVVTSASASSLPPPARPSPEPEKKKRKTSESGSSFSGEANFDGPKFVRNHIFPHTRISMDDASVRNHLNIMVQGSVRAAGICTRLLDILDKTPLSSLGSTQKVEELEGRIVLYQAEEKRLQEEVAGLKVEQNRFQEREKKLMAQCAMVEGLKEKAKQNYVRVFSENINLQWELEKGREAYQDLEDSVTESSEEAWRISKSRSELSLLNWTFPLLILIRLL
ncbi:uncharacterized protein LOC130950031 [Arachis stenosperma]|uniref:uncharacterized protein LOC130950031 n=1 Tax=Arachis stenosperma TaxID=217475 RepID=UPI0025AD4B87|nr:uncharacterized protein LOC130950031 [Arachis stenosperma]